MQSALGAACLTGMYSDNYVTGLSASVVVVVTADRPAGAPLHARARPFIPCSPCSYYLMLAGCWLKPTACWLVLVARWLLPAACSLVLVARWLLPAACWQLAG